MGDVMIELYWKHAPNTCRNFAELSNRGYYNGTKFHRIISDFMIQGGDPTGSGRGGASIYGKNFDDEIHASLKHTGTEKNDFIKKKINREHQAFLFKYYIWTVACTQI
jgi:peptidyl-prolyl cis-trans isomerase-like 1